MDFARVLRLSTSTCPSFQTARSRLQVSRDKFRVSHLNRGVFTQTESKGIHCNWKSYTLRTFSSPFLSLNANFAGDPGGTMSTGSVSDAEDLQEMEVLGAEGDCDGLKRKSNKDFCTSNDSNEDSSNYEHESPKKGRGASGKGRKTASKKSSLNGVTQEGKQIQRNAANARERARMRVLSKAFSRLKTTLPWVPPDTKLSKLDTLRLASSYIAHLRQILANDKYENGYIHPVNLTWPFMVAGKPENELKEVVNTARLCGTTAS